MGETEPYDAVVLDLGLPKKDGIEPDMQIARIRLSDKISRLHPRGAAAELGQAYEPEVPV